MKLTISAEGTDLAAQKKILGMIDDILFKTIPEGIAIEYKNIRTRNRTKKSLSTDEAAEEATAQEG